MGYVATTGVILYWKTDHTFYINRSHNSWFCEYNFCLSTEDKHDPFSLLLQKNPESLLHNSDMINLIPCKLDPKSTPFSDKTILTYEIGIPSVGKKIGFTLLDGEYFTTPYVIDTIPNSPASHKLPTNWNLTLRVFAV